MLEKNLEMSATDFAAEIITITINNLNLNRSSVDEECMTDVKKVVLLLDCYKSATLVFTGLIVLACLMCHHFVRSLKLFSRPDWFVFVC